MFTRRIVTGAASLLMIASAALGAVPAHATHDSTICSVHAAIRVTGGSGIMIQPTSGDTYVLDNFTIKCRSRDPVLDGITMNVVSTWVIFDTDSCSDTPRIQVSGVPIIQGPVLPLVLSGGGGTFEGTFTGGSLGSGTFEHAPHDPLPTGYSFRRVGSAVELEGLFYIQGLSYGWSAAMQFTPLDGECAGDLGKPTKHVDFTGVAEMGIV